MKTSGFFCLGISACLPLSVRSVSERLRLPGCLGSADRPVGGAVRQMKGGNSAVKEPRLRLGSCAPPMLGL